MIRRSIAAACLATLLATALAGGARAQSGGAPGCDVPGQIERVGGWDRIRLPGFESGPGTLVEYAVDPADPDRLYLHDGTSLLLSTDGGCRWKTTFSLEDPPEGADYTAADSAIVDLAVAPGHALLAISQGEGLRPHVVISSYGGETWRRGDEGLRTVTGPPLQAAFTPSNPQYAYLLTEDQYGKDDAGFRWSDKVLESTTSGGSWSTRDEPPLLPRGINTPVGQIGPSRFAGLAPDPSEAGKVFLYGAEGLSSFQAGEEDGLLEGEIAAAAALPGPTGGATTVLAAKPGRARVQVSRDAGLRFFSVAAPGAPDSFAEAMDPQDFYMSAEGRVLLRSRGRFTDLSPDVPVARLTSARSAERPTPSRSAEVLTLYGLSDGFLVRHVDRGTTQTPAAPGSVTVGELPPLDLAEPTGPLPGLLLPQGATVELREGESADVLYDLYVPPAPTPLDVMFDMDTSNSMLPAIDGLRAAMADIVEELSAAGIDAWFGVSHYRSYSTRPAFERLQDISPPGEGLTNALNSMYSEGGGDETQLESLYQIATGEGSTVLAGIAPNQQANWRKGSLRIIVHMTDEPISKGGPHRPLDTVAKALIDDDAIHFGIAVQNEATARALGAPLPGLIEISRESRSLAPDQGVDCDNDDIPDVYDGEPLVCEIDHVSSRDAAVMGGAILSVLRSVTDVGDVRLTARPAELADAGGRGTGGDKRPPLPAVSTTFPVVEGIDFKAHNRIGFGVSFTCPSIDRKEAYPVVIEGRREAGVLGRADATLVCDPIPEPAVEPDDPLPAPPQVALPRVALPLLAPAPPPVSPIQQPQPNPGPNVNPQPQPNPQGQAQAQIGMATQKQEQPQLAFAYSGKAPSLRPAPARELPGEERYLMSDHRERRSAPAPYPLYATAASLSLAFAWLQSRRQRAQAAVARRYRS